MAIMLIKVDQNVCIGDGSCVMIAAQSFKLNPDGKCYILNEDLGPEEKNQSGVVEAPNTVTMDPRDIIIEAARACPVGAIHLYEDDLSEISL